MDSATCSLEATPDLERSIKEATGADLDVRP